MGLFRRKPGEGKEPDELSGASALPETSAEAGWEEPEIEIPAGQGEPEESGPSRGLIEAPAEGSVVSGVVEVETRLADTAVPIEARLEWSFDGTEWAPTTMPGSYYEVVATQAGASPGPIALVRSVELSERTKLALASAGHEQVALAPARPSSWRGEGRLIAAWDTSDLAEGGCLLRLVTVAADRSEIASDPIRLHVDNEGPELGLRGAPAGGLYTGEVTLVATAEDAVSGVTLVELEISRDGEIWRRLSEARQEPYALRLDAEELADGAYKLRLVARDGSGNLRRGEPWEIEIANAPSAAELVDPGEFLCGHVNLIARAPDRRSTQMIFELAAAGSDDWRALGTTRAPFHLSIDTRQIVDGSYEIRIESLTAAGQSTYSDRFGPYLVDNTPPSVQIVKPRDGSELSERAELVVTVSDEASGPAQVVLSFTEGGEWRPLAALEPLAGQVRGFWQIGECQPGPCQLRATAFDRAGNEASQIIGLTIVLAAEAEPRPEPEPERAPVAEEAAKAAPPALHAPSSEAAARFGSLPSWDWPSPAQAAEERRGGEEAAEKKPSAEPNPELAPTATAPAEKPAAQGVAWCWTAKEEPEPTEKQESEQAAPEEKPEEKSVPEPEKKPEPEPEPEAEVEPEPEPEEPRLEEAGKEPEQAAPEEKPEPEAAQEEGPEPSSEEELEREESGRAARGGEGGRLISFPTAVRGWDIWQLSDLVEDAPGQDPVRQEERRQVLYQLREHAALDGLIPYEFDELVYEVFGELLSDDSGA